MANQIICRGKYSDQDNFIVANQIFGEITNKIPESWLNLKLQLLPLGEITFLKKVHKGQEGNPSLSLCPPKQKIVNTIKQTNAVDCSDDQGTSTEENNECDDDEVIEYKQEKANGVVSEVAEDDVNDGDNTKRHEFWSHLRHQAEKGKALILVSVSYEFFSS